eukprot:jgi/Mesen1/3847/ME000207S02847
MAKRYKRKGKDDFVDDSDGDKPASKSRKKGSGEDSGVIACELSKNRRVSVREWKGQVLVDIREYYGGSDGGQLPSKKGISLTYDQYVNLRDGMKEVDRAVQDIKRAGREEAKEEGEEVEEKRETGEAKEAGD